MLKGFETRTSNQIVVLTVPSLEGDILEEFSIRVAEEWKIGRRGKDNGAILLIALQDKAVRIEVGYGLEGELTDAECDRIIHRRILPSFREGKYYAGIADGLAGMTAILDPGSSPSPAPVERSEKVGISGFLFFFLFLLFFLGRLGQTFAPRRRYRSGWWGSGAGFGRGGLGGGGGFGGGGGGHFGGGGASGRW
jgi:uncharacterized protein